MTRRAAALLATLLLTTTGCSGDDDATATTVGAPITNPRLPPSSTTSPTSSVASTIGSTTTSSAASTSTTLGQTDSTTTAPPPATTGSPPPTTPEGDPDWLAIVTELSAVVDRLQANPVAAGVADFCLSGDNPCQRETGDTVRLFVEEGWRVVDTPPNTVVGATLNSTANGDPINEAAFVVVLVELGPVDDSESRVVDEDGETVFDLSTGESNVVTRANWVLSREVDGSWRVFSVMAIG